jgi:histone deacetylase complex regulatory component SIN3
LHNYAKEIDMNKVKDVYRQVRELFAGKEDLIEGFKSFLPGFVKKSGSGGEGSVRSESAESAVVAQGAEGEGLG